MKPGEYVRGKGVFVGTFDEYSGEAGLLKKTGSERPFEINKISGKSFFLYAFPNDMDLSSGWFSKGANFTDTVEAISNLKGKHGHDGATYETAADLYSDLASGGYSGQWVLPTRAMLEVVYDAREEGALQGTFQMHYDQVKAPCTGLYWTIDLGSGGFGDLKGHILLRFDNTRYPEDFVNGDRFKAHNRPVRLEYAD